MATITNRHCERPQGARQSRQTLDRHCERPQGAKQSRPNRDLLSRDYMIKGTRAHYSPRFYFLAQGGIIIRLCDGKIIDTIREGSIRLVKTPKVVASVAHQRRCEGSAATTDVVASGGEAVARQPRQHAPQAHLT